MALLGRHHHGRGRRVPRPPAAGLPGTSAIRSSALLFVVIPAVFVLGLILIPVGARLSARRRRLLPMPLTDWRSWISPPSPAEDHRVRRRADRGNLVILSWHRSGGSLHGDRGVLRPGLPYHDGAAVRRASERSARARGLRRVPCRPWCGRTGRVEAGRYPPALAGGEAPGADADSVPGARDAAGPRHVRKLPLARKIPWRRSAGIS